METFFTDEVIKIEMEKHQRALWNIISKLNDGNDYTEAIYLHEESLRLLVGMRRRNGYDLLSDLQSCQDTV